MNCPHCGSLNMQGSTFCIRCGADLKKFQVSSQNPSIVEPVNQTIIQNNEGDIQSINTRNEGKKEYIQSASYASFETINLKIVPYFLALFMKPISTFKENSKKLNDFKTSIFLSATVAIVMTIFNLIRTMLSVVRVVNYSWFEKTSYSWKFENLKEIKYIEVIGKSLVMNVTIIVVIAFLFYIGSLIIKRQSNYIKMLGITATAILPLVLGSLLFAPILGIIMPFLSLLFTSVGGVFSLFLFYEFVNDELCLEANLKVYFHLASLAVLLLIAYFVLTKVLDGVTSIGIGSILR